MSIIRPKEIFLTSSNDNRLIIRSISPQDIELLRVWKNDHRDSFFFKQIITAEMQKKWFQSYSKRNDDFMMVVLLDSEKIGCIGFRVIKDTIDLYNVILGQKKFARRGYMANALKLVCREAMRRYPKIPIIVSVLKSNLALQWYLRRGFVAASEYEKHLDLIFAESQS